MKQLKDLSLKELVNQISITGGIHTDMESICIMQDIIGHSSIEDVKAVANSEQKESFYRLYGHCYGTVEAIKYYLNNSNQLADQIEGMQDKIDFFENGMQQQTARADKAEETLSNYQVAYMKEKTETDLRIASLEDKNRKQKEEILLLKAKLYDIITA